MKKLLTTGILSAILAAGFAGAIHAAGDHAGHKHAHEKQECGKSAEAAQACVRKCEVMCNATVEVTNTDNGVVVKVTASNPEDVKKIQECWAKRSACKAARGEVTKKAPATCGSTKKVGTCPSMKAE